MIYWYHRCRRQGKWNIPLYLLHAITVSSCRLVGLPLVILPLLYEHLNRKENKPSFWIYSLFLAAFSSLGFVGFFVFNQIQFHRWNLPFLVQKIGWGNRARYLAPLYPKFYFPHLKLHWISFLHEACIPLFLILLILTFRRLRKTETPFQSEPWVWWVLSCLLYYVSFARKADNSMFGMLRYLLPVYLLLLLINASQKSFQMRKRLSGLTFITGCLSSLVVELVLLVRFLKGLPVS